MQRRTDWRRTVTILPKHHPLCSRGNCPCHRMCHDTMQSDSRRKVGPSIYTFKECKVNPTTYGKIWISIEGVDINFWLSTKCLFYSCNKNAKERFCSTYRNQLSSYLVVVTDSYTFSILACELLIPVGRFRTIRQQTVEQVGMNEWHCTTAPDGCGPGPVGTPMYMHPLQHISNKTYNHTVPACSTYSSHNPPQW